MTFGIWLGAACWLLELLSHLVALDGTGLHILTPAAAELWPRLAVLGVLTGSALLTRRALRQAAQPPVDARAVALLNAHRQDQQALHESEAKYRALIEQSNDAIYLLQGDRLLYNNRRFAELLGVDQEILARDTFSIMDYVAPSSQAMIAERARLSEAGQLAELQPRYEFTARRQDGTEVEVEASVTYLTYGGDVATQGLLRDITARKQAEAALRESEDRFRSVFEHTPIGMALLDVDGHFWQVNQALCDLTGYDERDLLAQTLRDMTVPEDRENIYDTDSWRRVVEGELVAYQVEKRLRHKTGDPVWVLANTTVIYERENQPPYLILQVQDITERKQAEEALRASQHMLRRVIDHFPGLVFWKDRESVYQGCNMTFARAAGLRDPAGIIGKTDYDLPWANTEADAYRADDRAVIDSGTAKLSFEETQTQADGQVIWYATSKVPLHDAAGRVVGVLGTSDDITARKRAADVREHLLTTLQRRNTQLRTAAAVSKSASTLLDPQALIQETVTLIRDRFGFYYVGLFLLNEEATFAVLQAGTGEAGRAMVAAGHRLEVGGASMVGQCVAQAQARIALDVGREAVRFDNPALPETRSEMALPLVTRGRCIGAITIQSAEEAAFSEEDIATLQSMMDQLAAAIDNAWLYDAARREIDRRMTAEQAIRELNESLERRVQERTAELKAANKELEAFSYSVSHDLRAPLRSIDGFSQALLEDYGAQLDEDGIDYLNRVRAASQRMAELIDDLLKLSRVTRAPLQRQTVDLSAVAAEIASDWQRRDPARTVTFAIAAQVQVYGDPRLLRIVLENLLANAWKFTAGQAAARIALETMTDETGQLIYCVRDNGAGFDMDYAGKLFGAFQRLHSPEEFEGNGIGLATVKRIIRRHGGRVWAEGAVGQGASFYFTLPDGKGREPDERSNARQDGSIGGR